MWNRGTFFSSGRSRRSCAWLSAWLLALVALPARAEIVVSNLTEPLRDFNTLDALVWSAQSFETDARTRGLARVSARVGGELGSSGAFAEIRRATPTGEMDTSPVGLVGTLALPDLTGPRSPRDFLPTAPITLEASTRYFVFLGAAGPGSFEWSYAQGNAQSGVGSFGSYQYTFDGGAVWSNFGTDDPFHLEVEAAALDEFVLVSNVTEPIRAFNLIDAATWAAQSFETDGQTYALTSIRARVGNEIASSGAFVELRASLPTGEMDASPAGLIDTLVVPDLSGPRALRTFVPSTPTALAPSTRYYLLLGATGPGSFEWSYAEGNGQMGPGTLADYQYTFDGGGIWSNFGSENPFHTEVRALPEPGLGMLLACGVVAMSVRQCGGRRRDVGRMPLEAGAGMPFAMALVLVLCAAASIPASASDGRIELSQACAMAGGCVPGDGPGFPISLAAGGSYVLTSNLTVPDANTSGIEIQADDVTLDFNGFTLAGPGTVPITTHVCSHPGTGVGIFKPTNSPGSGFTVRNGHVRGMGSTGIDVFAALARVESMVIERNCGLGLNLGLGAIVRDSQIRANALAGINASSSSRISDCVVDNNGGDGIYATRGVIVSGTTVSSNQRHGMLIIGIASGNVAVGNLFYGISADSAIQNFYDGNGSYGISSTASGLNVSRDTGNNTVATYTRIACDYRLDTNVLSCPP